jgi:hypothetical protein
MNFISKMEGEEIQIELKYCERCGGLWLRRQGTTGVYCRSCSVCLAARPDPGEPPPRKTSRRKARLPKARVPKHDLQSSARIESLQGVAAMEVRV